MNKKQTITIAMVAIVVAGISVFGTTSLNIDNEVDKTKTNPAEFTNENYFPMDASYITTDTMQLASLSEDVIKGKITNIRTESVPVAEPEEGLEIPTMDETIYTIKVDEKIKGKKSTLEIVTQIPSKIDYKVGDKVLVMSSSFGDKNLLIGGPHSMFKLEKGKAIGHEFTFEEDGLSNVVKTAEDKSKELNKSKGS